jgi:hypothetical protein
VTARRRRLALLLLSPLVLVLGFARTAAAQDSTPDRTVVLILIDRASFEELLSIPQVRSLAGAGGAALLSSPVPLRDELAAAELGSPPVSVIDLASVQGSSGEAAPARLRRAGAAVESALVAAGPQQKLVILATPSPSEAMQRSKDDLTGLVMASGSGVDLLARVTAPAPRSASLTTLTSDSTRRSGVVASVDVVPTIEAYLGRDVGDAATIRRDPGEVPFEMHRRYLAERRMSVSIQTGAAIYVALAGLFGVGVLALRDRALARLRRAGALAAISVLPLGVCLLFAGHLPSLAYATVVPAIVLGTAAATLAIGWLVERRGATAAVGLAGAATLALFVVEAALGWTAALTPFLGGGELDGGRYYGLPNVDIGLLLGAAVFVAVWLRSPSSGAGVLVTTALFAGLPWTGSNLGGAVTVFAGAGLWFAVRRSGRLGMAEAGMGLSAAVAGMLLVLVAHRYLAPFPTHITRFAHGESGGVVGTVIHRLGVGLDLIARNPFALIPVLGVPACLWVVLRPPGPIIEALARAPVWREGIIVILAASIVAYVANDSGAAALGLGFGTGLGALVYVSLIEPEGMMGA